MNAEVALDAYLATREGADDLDDLAPSEALISKRQRLLADAEEAKGSDPWPVGRQVDWARGNSSNVSHAVALQACNLPHRSPVRARQSGRLVSAGHANHR